MKSGPGPSTISLSANSRTIDPLCPSDRTVSEPVVGVAFPGGPRTIPGCQELNAGGALTDPRISETTRSGKQSVSVPAETFDARHRPSAAPAAA
jgi:hypothetical protein